MAINWYPGHMHKARKQMLEVLPNMDIIIEMVDARIPHSSENPAIAELRSQKPCIKLLSKSDLADPATTEAWQKYWLEQKGTPSLAITTKEPGRIKQLPELIRKLVASKVGHTRKIQALIVGIPNVGKSTLINYLSGRNAAKVGNEPAVTKAQQQVHLSDDIVLNDTPGILWPKFENDNSGYRLAITGAIRDTAIEYEDIALFALRFLAQHHPEALTKRYQVAIPDLTADHDADIALLEAVGRRRGAKASGGRVNFHKAAELVIHDYRSGELGAITLETPEMIERELVVVAQQQAEKEAIKQAKLAEKAKRKSGLRH
ncbi:ribosome biogenesis GTPase YlqF [Halioxenophilus sp. WMMB6]|uniref:ribosome biogenesis GTPase YlqF n=1 Tax=Halioxenophilus sp. WMMB6 TaxID=3073815 RepID=UPI00295EFACE|nr:ribosome biogenesis GTPase YlqF [Halioxenophilus sp. WMMB6]